MKSQPNAPMPWASDKAIPAGRSRNPSPISSTAAANCNGTSMFQPRARSRVNTTDINGPPSTITTVLMFWIH